MPAPDDYDAFLLLRRFFAFRRPLIRATNRVPFIKPSTGYLAGEYPGGATTVEGVPQAAEVRVQWRDPKGGTYDGYVVARTVSATDGTWRVDGLDPTQRYDVVGRKAGFNDVIVSNVQPKV